MAQSIPSYMINFSLKYFVKPIISRVRMNDRNKVMGRNVFEAVSKLIPVPGNVHIEYVNINNMQAEWVQAGFVHQERIILYFHGGGYFFGSARTHRPLTWRLSRACRGRVLAINYRQTPEFEYPAPLEDAVMSYKWLLNQGYRPENIVFGGDSAGGNLTLVTIMKLRELGLPLPRAAMCLSPWADLSNSSESLDYNKNHDPMIPSSLLKFLARSYVGSNDPRDPYLSPVYGDYTGFPPLLLYVGSTELLLDDVHKVAVKAEAAGVNVTYRVWREMFHVFPLAATFLPEGFLALKGMRRFVTNEVFADNPSGTGTGAFSDMSNLGSTTKSVKSVSGAGTKTPE